MIELWQFHGGIKLEGHKSLSNKNPIVQANIPQFLVLPLLQHIGDPTKPIVEVGEKVLKGQMIAHCHEHDCSKRISTPVHASSSGTIVAIEPRAVPHPSGLRAPCIVIETDGQDTWFERVPLTDYMELPPSVARTYIAQAGIVGLGGAGFPSHLKLKPEGIDTLIINGAECEPYITCDDRLMREEPDKIIAGASIIRHVLGGAKRCIIAIEDNKAEAYSALLETAQQQQEQVEIIQVPTIYPMGGEKQLIHVLTGQEVERGKLPASIGIVVHNVKTARAVYRAVQQGQALISRIVTVTGNGIKNPQNLEVRLGTPMHVVIEQCGRKSGIKRLIMGGSMMGFALPNDDMPIVKTTNSLIVSRNDEIETPSLPMPCIRCGACANACPIHLLPQQLYWYAKAKDFKKVRDYHIFDCIECGCCAYECPSHIPLVSYYRYAKAEIIASERDRKKADLARQRHEFRTFRLKREKAEKATRHKQKKAVSDNSKETAIKAALEKSKAKYDT
ncbi:electron transport complex subunit RsxC [Candidatus Parabeggiatoa sp. HSG14]|uniref:electron transport complex subunit RsxC n=1 Tax=Candidatus Parabeggiatoa sp. HSG14 TaxID=3055593 RepID=UPI0025A8E83D|nr:electron transport complex subunit RsxC [Thiotrichales bacterium HSG14]